MKKSSLSPLLAFAIWILSTPQISPINLHAEFFELYGNDVNTSGIWEPVRSFASDKNKLTSIAFQAHSNSWMQNNSESVKEVFFETGTLPAEGRKYDDIQIDLIKYSVLRTKNGEIVRGPSSFFYLAKGMKPDCVFYCWMRGLNTGRFYLDYHVCNIVMPTT